MRQKALKLHILRLSLALMAAILLCTTLFSTVALAADTDSGKVGGVKWSFSAGVLTLTGKNAMPDFSEGSPAPWATFKEQITQVEMDSRLTSVGDMAFYECTALTGVKLSKNIKTVGQMAFAGCEQLQSVTLPAVTVIKDYAFSRCFRLQNVILPETLTQLGASAFYRCEGLRSIRVPAGVKQMGDAVFAYCSGLLWAEIAAPIEILPSWTFYGCEQLLTLTLPEAMQGAGDSAFTRCDVLANVYHRGGQENQDSLLEDLQTQLPDFSDMGVVPAPEVIPPAVDKDYVGQEGTIEETVTQVTTGNGANIETNTAVTYPYDGKPTDDDLPKQEAEIEIEATLSNKDGWDTLQTEIEKQIFNQGVLKQETDKAVPLTVQTQLLYGSVIYGKTLEALAGKNLVLNITTPSGSAWRIHCAMLTGKSFKKSYDLDYSRTPYTKLSKAHKKVLGAAQSYWLEFADKIDFPATVLLYISPQVWQQTASLYESSWIDGLDRLQTVQVGQDGVAPYAMGNVNKGKRYVVALNVAGISAEQVRLPQNDETEDWLENYVPVTQQYTITAVRGFGGMTVKQFTTVVLCVVGGLAFVVFVAVLVINLLSKQKALKQMRQK